MAVADLEKKPNVDLEGAAPEYVGTVAETNNLKRGLKARHVQFIAIGGVIGTGLFVGSGEALVRAGPLSIFLAYSIVGTVIYSLMLAIGEMSSYLPLPGGLTVYADRYLDSSWGFAMGWNYTIGVALTVCAEVSAALSLVHYWTDKIPDAVLIVILIGVILLLNIFAVEGYGEAEFIFASFKVITIIGLLILAVVLFFGGGPNHDRLGFRYWKHPGAMKAYLVAGDRGRFCGFLKSFVNAVFAFGGSEVICVAASETANPRKNIPKAVRRTFWRVLIFYVFGVLAIGVLVPYNDFGLNNAIKNGLPGAASSPWVAAMVNSGISGLPHIINAVILTSAWSAGNSFTYAASRNLYALAITGHAPKIFAWCTKRGIPLYSVLAVSLMSCLSFMAVSNNAVTVFSWFLNVTTLSSLFNWATLFLSAMRFRKAYVAQGNSLADLPFRSPAMPYTAYYGLGMVSFFILISGFDSFFPPFDAQTFVADYCGMLLFIVPFIGHKLWFRNWLRPLDQVDITTGKAEIDDYERMNPPPVARNTWERIWFKIA